MVCIGLHLCVQLACWGHALVEGSLEGVALKDDLGRTRNVRRASHSAASEFSRAFSALRTTGNAHVNCRYYTNGPLENRPIASISF